jgi:hypothetical protein
MTTLQVRKFGILDAMIMVVATAAGLSLFRTIDPLSHDPLSWSTRSPRVYCAVLGGVRATVPFLVTWTPVLIVLRLRRPRPRWRRLARQPGLVACSIATLILMVGCLNLLSLEGLPSDRFYHLHNRMVFFDLYPGYGVAGAWLILISSGRWRPELSGIDRLGRALGLVWMIVGLITQGLPLLL